MSKEPMNFGVIYNNVYRSGLPSQHELTYVLIKDNLNVVVDLTETEQKDLEECCKLLGVEYNKIPLSSRQRIPEGIFSKIAEILKIPEKENDELTETRGLIFCENGQHVTGVIASSIMLSLSFNLNEVLVDLFNFGFGDPLEHPELWKDILYLI